MKPTLTASKLLEALRQGDSHRSALLTHPPAVESDTSIENMPAFIDVAQKQHQ
jgi:hypothetical protein